MKTVLVQIYRSRPEEALLRRFANAFLRRGYRTVVWSNREHGNAGLPMIPLSGGAADDALLDLQRPLSGSSLELEMWRQHERALETRYGERHPAFDTDRCFRTARLVLESVRPSLLLGWGGSAPPFAIPRAVAEELKIPSVVWGAGFLADTFLLDRHAHGTGSEWCRAQLTDTAQAWKAKAESYLDAVRSALERKIHSAIGNLAASGDGPTILVLGGMDMGNGIHGVPGGGPRTLPNFEDGIALALAAARAHPWGRVVYRPHPGEPELPLRRLRGSRVIVERDADLERALASAHAVIGYGGRADFKALALGKPFIMAGLGLVLGKGCAYEALTEDALAGAISRALGQESADAHRMALRDLVAWMLWEGLYNRHSTDGACRKNIEDLAADALAHADSGMPGGDFRLALSESGQAWWRTELVRHRLYRRCDGGGEPLARVREHVRSLGPDALPVLDFDHTLWLGNSTEQFVAHARPRALGEAVDSVAARVWDRFRHRIPFERDQLRVLAIGLVAPWVWLTWRLRARKAARTFWNARLYEAATEPGGKRPIVVSFGFRILIHPLLRASMKAVSATQDPQLVASGLLGRRRGLRSVGKVEAVESACGPIKWSEVVTVSDSREDEALLSRAGKSTLTRWSEPPHESPPGYFPFRYVGQGKYPGFQYVKQFILGMDLVVWMILFVNAPRDLVPALLLFLSFHAVYEIGHYRNDFVAALRESSPVLSTAHQRFANYPIARWAWIFGVSTGAIGCYLARSGWSWSILAAWLAVLAVLQGSFAVYNRLPPEKRIPMYLVLQTLKNFSGVVALVPNVVGIALAAGHFFQHSAAYLIYRCGGDRERLPRAQVRAYVLVVGLGLFALAGQPLPPLHMVVALVWAAYQIGLEHFGPRVSATRLMRRVWRRGWRRLGRLLRPVFSTGTR